MTTTPFRLPKFYPVLDTAVLALRRLSVSDAAGSLLAAGVRILQYRHKGDWYQSHYDEAAALARRCEKAGVLFVLNDRADYAKLLRCALHIGQDDLPPAAARKIVDDEVMGYSTHNRGQLRIADAHPVEYLSLGPIFETSSKAKPDPVVGLDGLQALRPLTAKPLCAIGGITLENAGSVLAAGADSVAVISSLFPNDAPNKKQIRQHAELWLQTVEGNA